MPTPAPSPSPAIALVPTQDAATDIATFLGLEGVRHSHLLVTALEALLLLAFYALARAVLGRLLARFERRLSEAQPARASRLRTLAGMVGSLAQFALAFVFLVSSLSLVGVNVAAILGTASVAGLAVGFGAQKLVKDVITGFFLLLEDQYAVGEYVTVGGVTGTVEDLGMRITRLRDDDGRLYILSNGDIATVCNHSRGSVTGTLDLPVSATADLAQATELLNAALAQNFASLGLSVAPKIDGVAAIEAAKTTLRVVFAVPPGQRVAPYALKLRELARQTLAEAKIPLG